MSHTVLLNNLSDELVQLITNFSPTKNAVAYKESKEAALRGLRHHRFGRTNQFNIHSSLQGLVEKFHILNNDPVAEALESRLKSLGLDGEGRKPEILSLLLQLSDRPVENVRLEDLAQSRPPTPLASLTWEDLERDEPLQTGEIWNDIDYTLGSSDDETGTHRVSSDSDASVCTRESPASSEQAFDVRSLIVTVDESALNAVQAAQAWRNRRARKTKLDEVQLIREVLHALRGLPSSLFQDAGEAGSIAPVQRVCLSDCSASAVDSVLLRVADIATSINTLRLFTQKRTSRSILQAFLANIEAQLDDFDKKLALAEASCVNLDGPVIVSILSILEETEQSASFLQVLNALVASTNNEIWQHSYRLLDHLFDATCRSQLEGDEQVFEQVRRTFVRCLVTYLDPVRKWMLDGVIDDSRDRFIVQVQNGDVGLDDFWRRKYSLRGGYQQAEAPAFMRPFLRDIFAAGKSVALVQELGLKVQPHENNATDDVGLNIMQMHDSNGLSGLLPFAEVLHTSLNEWIRSKQSITWPPLRSHLISKYQLYETIEIIHTVYLSSVGNTFDAFLNDVASQVTPASNPTVSEALTRTVFAEAPPVNARMLSLTLDQHNLKKKGLRRLESITLDYALSWPIANIIPHSSLSSYQSCSHLILQLKSGVNALSILRLRPVSDPATPQNNAPARRALQLRHRLAHVLYATLTHITQQVIQSSYNLLRTSLQEAQSFDAMIAAHEQFVTSISNGTFQVSALATAREAMVNVCNLAVLYAETVSKSAETDGEQSHRTMQMKQGLSQLKQLVDVTVGDLRAASRSEEGAGQAGWEALAERLDWSVGSAM